MIHDDTGKQIKSLVLNGNVIKAGYMIVGDVLRKVFGASTIYYGFGSSDTTPTEEGMESFAARYAFSPIVVTPPLFADDKPDTENTGQNAPKQYFYMYVPVSFEAHTAFYLNGMACTPIEAGRGRVINGEEYVCYRFGGKQHSSITIEGRYE